MYLLKTRRRFSIGDRVRMLREHDSWGIGTIQQIAVDYDDYCYSRLKDNEIRENEWITMIVVKFDGHNSISFVELGDIVKDEQVRKYESLEPGDLVFHGKHKQECSIVLENREKRAKKGSIDATTRVVTILENGVKKPLPLKQEIMAIQRVRDYQDYM